MVKIFVLGFSYKTYDTTLLKLFSEYGAVHSVYIASDERTGKKLNFGFIEMNNKEEAANAITALNGSELHNRKITVRIADKKDKSEKPAAKPSSNSSIEVKVTTAPSGETVIKKKRPRISK
ncbi:RNA recognition motif domain-containing protein [Pedobacter sp. GR22-6]|uniref:RNA recognition motif domain-containing protein n=1 Tax=Pedobacter sp. GR22-6 TaxID=3127957 RepID=UPI00307E4502